MKTLSSASRVLAALSALVGMLLTGCAHGASRSSMKNPPQRTSDTLLVMVPGRGDDSSTFEREGFVEALGESGAQADYVMVAAPRHLRRPAEYTRMLHERVVEPARASGYTRIVMAGVSQGGFRVLSYIREHGGSIDGAFVIAPFLGPAYYIDDIHRQGGLHAWSTNEQEGWWTTGFYMWATAQDIDGLWRWVQDGGATEFDLHVAWGTSDVFAPAAQLLADSLPHSRRLATDGGHEWETWRRLWSQFLERDPYGLTATPAPPGFS